LAAYEDGGLTGPKLTALLGSIAPEKFELQLPRFKLTGASISLKPVLEAMGMNAAFGAADFSGISSSELKITDVVHQASLEIDEGGLEAAAATAVFVGETSAPGLPVKKVIVDKPFIAVLRDTATGQILFIARVSDPR
jgi:serpin B